LSVLAAEGYRADTHAVLATIDARGRLVQRAARSGEQVFTPSETYLVTSALEGAVERGTARGVRAYGYEGPVAAKTGTSNDFRDAWLVGYTPTLAVAVWVGFDDGRSLGLPGARAALPIFGRLIAATQESRSARAFRPPPDLETVTVCGRETEYFLPGTAPPMGAGCSAFEEVPRWIAGAGASVLNGVRSLLGNLLGRPSR
jgi:membrane carboxypeptidase/penicillin-binding protein